MWCLRKRKNLNLKEITFEQLRKIISKVMNLEKEEIILNSSLLEEDLGVDSLNFFEILMDVEDLNNMDFDSDFLKEFYDEFYSGMTVENLLTIINKYIASIS